MDEKRLSRALRSVGDDYVRRNPADFEALREGVTRKRRRRWFLMGFGSTAVAATAAIAVLIVGAPRSGTDTLPPAGAEGLEITTDVPIEGVPGDIASIGERLLVGLPASEQIVELSIGATEVERVYELPGRPSDILGAPGEAWVSLPDEDALVHIDLVSGDLRQVPLAGFTSPTRLHVGAEAVRAVVDQGVVAIPLTGDEALRPRLLYEGPVIDIAMGSTAFWVLGRDGNLRAIDPDTGAPSDRITEELPFLGRAGEITYLREALWFAESGRTDLVRIDESTGRVTGEVTLPGGYIDIDAGDAGLWVVLRGSVGGSLSELDDIQGRAVGEPFELVGAAADLSVNDEGIWVVLETGDAVHLDEE
jgi:hypothetical protein